MLLAKATRSSESFVFQNYAVTLPDKSMKVKKKLLKLNIPNSLEVRKIPFQLSPKLTKIIYEIENLPFRYRNETGKQLIKFSEISVD
jgi:hypothetical protein